MYNGIINVYKEKDFTSHDVVAVLRGILGQKKIGHTGTLDPQAVGILPVCLGKATKVADLLTDKDKTYKTRFKLGEETDTQDHTGEVIDRKPYSVDNTTILETIKSFLGDHDQLPPMYSAIKIDGRKLYDVARSGQTIERKKRRITIYDIYDIQIDLPFIEMTVHCKKGTYIRTLCRDISEALGTCGHMVELERTASGIFTKETALTLEDIKNLVHDNKISEAIVQVDTLFSHYQRFVINPDYNLMLYNGNKLPLEAIMNYDTNEIVDKTCYNVYNNEGDYMGIYEWLSQKNLLMPVKFFCIRH
ncbi:tRNA pseudouridine(55) synthase TruB [Petrocella sp. FN5]|uniref:tRNA pseudouridine(55) synthase TruB n=1 Tax=Petrocella sp. FN5 TaxID=3032002 RepID=UPI0023DB0041|nr:tRNA pseudouridine(55) synthase TruB [Petrocella sp. FN5]MDF1616360.1 tRNA pseudouridine(55) synthase TruB [Petrocella sp. FN5]